MSNYLRNKLKARTFNNLPTETDQSQAKDTDINVIVGRFLKGGTVPGNRLQPQFGVDLTNRPLGLRDMIDTARELEAHRARLPEKLRNMPTNELLALTPEQLRDILKPPAPPPAPTGGNP